MFAELVILSPNVATTRKVVFYFFDQARYSWYEINIREMNSYVVILGTYGKKIKWVLGEPKMYFFSLSVNISLTYYLVF